jgi:iron complex transport system ATP-binding protein
MIHPILSTHDLTIGYGSKKGDAKHIAKHLNLVLQPGKLVCLLGPNGAGKSTLMRTISGLQPPMSGHVLIGGADIQALDIGEMAKRLSVVLTERVQTGNLTVQEIVTLGRTPYTNWMGKLTVTDHEKINWAMQVTDTHRHADQRISQLSDGEKQKVMLARALAQDTNLILLDEPTAHLDLPHRVEMMHLLHHLAHQMNKAILLSTHELDLALQTADELWLMNPNHAFVSGIPEDLVLSGAFQSAFARPGFNFDLSTGTFSIHPPAARFTVSLTGADTDFLFWTQKALKRAGIATKTDTSLPIQIEIKGDQNNFWWQVQQANRQEIFSTIEALLQYLNQ